MLAIRQLVIVALRGILREVVDELSIVSLGVVEVATLAIGMRVRRRNQPTVIRLLPDCPSEPTIIGPIVEAAAPREMRFLSHCPKAIKLDSTDAEPRVA